MLLSTFRHIEGVGKKTESSLWKQGITSWDKYISRKGIQLPLFSERRQSILEASRRAFEKRDIAFFAKSLPSTEHYRVALTYPEETLFLDIETTGLSLYYDELTMVGWSLGRTFSVYIRGQSEESLRQTLRSAKALVTFNGTLFDVKFLQKTFRDITLPAAHIDLRFFGTRVGLSGGQKKLEQQLGFRRPASIRNMKGESAPILWHEYRRGNIEALKKLITYNHADIEGMKRIFDCAVHRLYELEAMPRMVRSKTKFSVLRSTIDLDARNQSGAHRISLQRYRKPIKPLIDYRKLNKVLPLDELTIVGIDLVSSQEKSSGYCIIEGNRAETQRVKTDAEMIERAFEAGAHLISIDSPLSLPRGRTSFFDSDRTRQTYGITRECEHLLRRRGIHVYPCLIPSMQALTRRGVRLAQKFRKVGVPVIESYPGAAQDIMGIPRKKAGIEYLSQGLAEFGIAGDFLAKKISHDELDAITSAIVGLFFWTGMFEALGNSDEEYLIIPRLNGGASRFWISRKVFGLSGSIGSGKSIAAEYLAKSGFQVAHFSGVLEEILREQNKQITRTNLQKIGAEIHKEPGQGWLGKRLLASLPPSGNVVIDGLRFPEEHAFMVETFGPAFKHIHLEAPAKSRQQRINDRQRDNIPFKQAERVEVESEIALLRNIATDVLINDRSLSTLHRRLRSLLN